MTSILLVVLFLYISVTVILGMVFSRGMLRVPKRSDEKVINDVKNHGVRVEEILSRADEVVNVDFPKVSKWDYKSEIIFYKGNSNRGIILCHGVSGNRFAMLKYVELFQKHDFNIISFDFSRFGSINFPSYGYFERYQLKHVYDWARKKYPEITSWGVMGESMGGGTVYQAMPLLDDLAFLISDSSFSSTVQMEDYVLSRLKIPTFIWPGVKLMCHFIYKFRSGFLVEDANPLKYINSKDIPVLLVHGTTDIVCPFYMSEQLRDKRGSDKCHFLAVEGADHVYSIVNNPEAYAEAVAKFFEEVYPASQKLSEK